MYTNSLVELDRAHLVHPLASYRGHERAVVRLAALEPVVDKARKTPLPAAAAPGRRVLDRAWDNGLVIRAFAQGVFGYAMRA